MDSLVCICDRHVDSLVYVYDRHVGSLVYVYNRHVHSFSMVRFDLPLLYLSGHAHRYTDPPTIDQNLQNKKSATSLY